MARFDVDLTISNNKVIKEVIRDLRIRKIEENKLDPKKEFPHLYKTWKDMVDRCYDANHPKYENYGRRGTKVSDDFYDYEYFARWSFKNGYRGNTMTLIMKDEKGNFTPVNAQWVERTSEEYKSYVGKRSRHLKNT